MIVKRMDSKQAELEELSSLLKEKLSPKQRFLIEREARAIQAGTLGEKDSAYYIDYYFEESKNWAVIHDLRLEHEGKVAQIDHILVNRLFHIFVLESKNYSYGIKITSHGEFESYSGKQSFGIPSPIEQNKRHVHFLEHFLKEMQILPKRLGISIRPKFHSLILISPKCRISRPSGNKFDTDSIIKADALQTTIMEKLDQNSRVTDLASLGKLFSLAAIEEVATKLASFHRPIKRDFRAQFGLPEKHPPKPESADLSKKPAARRENGSNYFCAHCKQTISANVAKFCWQNSSKFGGRAYCIQCQKSVG